MPITSTPIEKGSVLNRESSNKSASKSKNIEFFLSEPSFSFDDMVLEPGLRDEIENAIALFSYREKLFNEWNLGRVIKHPVNLCINLYGESGTGKTMAANAIAKELGMKVLRVNYADIESKYVGETSKNLVSLFEYAKTNNAVILFDEADALLSKRVTDMSSATDVSVNQTRSVMLTILDTYEGIVLFTTNFISNYDPAFMRRISHHIKFELPNEALRSRLLEHYLTNTIPNRIDIVAIARKYPGISGADISNAIVNCALKAARNNKEYIDDDDIEYALSKILAAKIDNQTIKYTVTERNVPEQYAFQQMGIKVEDKK